jgi:hypothetical protein
MIEPMDGMPDGTLGFRVAGEVDRSDYTDVMVPELRKAVEQGGGLRTLYLIDRLEEMARASSRSSRSPSSMKPRPGWPGRKGLARSGCP